MRISPCQTIQRQRTLLLKTAWPLVTLTRSSKVQEIDSEYNNIQTAVATKANTASPTFTGTVTIPTLTVTGTVTADTIDGGTY